MWNVSRVPVRFCIFLVGSSIRTRTKVSFAFSLTLIIHSVSASVNIKIVLQKNFLGCFFVMPENTHKHTSSDTEWDQYNDTCIETNTKRHHIRHHGKTMKLEVKNEKHKLFNNSCMIHSHRHKHRQEINNNYNGRSIKAAWVCERVRCLPLSAIYVLVRAVPSTCVCVCVCVRNMSVWAFAWYIFRIVITQHIRQGFML